MIDEYSLWLMPSGEVYEDLDELIRKLSKNLDSPYFPPHLTLLGKISLPKKELILKTQALSSDLSPFQILLENIDYSENYFKSIYLEAKRSPPLLDANLKARKIFEMEGDYMPHLSIAYSNAPQESKKTAMENLQKDQNLSFEADKIYIYSTTGPVNEWFRLKSFDLK